MKPLAAQNAFVYSLILLIALLAGAAPAATVSIDRVFNPDDIIFMYPVDHTARITYNISNPASSTVPLIADFTFLDCTQQNHSSQAQSFQAAPGTVTPVTFTLDPASLPFGQYAAHLILKSGGAEIVRSTTCVGVISATNLGKAKPGEFLFGLDTSLGASYLDPRLLRFTQFMGTDIIRNGIENWADRIDRWSDLMRAAAPVYRKYALKLAYDIDPPDNRIAHPQLYLQKAIAHAQWVAENYKDLIPYYELGNEPDIGFFQGPMSMYADGFRQLRAAIKRGNPDAQVMNGGWAFDLDRVKQFFQIIKPDDIDIIAYHGHGDVLAEERAYRNIKAIATAAGFGDKQLTETESGIMAFTPAQEQIQARVCVEKFSFAQSMKEPFFHWFRLSFEHPLEYGDTYERTQPRPSVLAYRATVEILRGYKFKQTLPLPYPDSEGYEFDQISGPGRAIVLWVNGHNRRQAYLNLAAQPTDVTNVATSDIYGNHHPFSLLQGQIASLSISQEPIWLLWSAATPFDVAVSPALLDAPPVAELQVNSPNPLVIQVRNPLDIAVPASFNIQAHSDAPLKLTPSTASFELQPHQVKRVDIAADVGDVQEVIHWPQKWTVFSRTNAEIDTSSFTDIPAQLPGPAGPVTPTQEILRDGKIDLATLSAYKRNVEVKIPSIVMAYVDSEQDRTVTMGAGADFWMEWYLNGQPVFDDLANGNGPGTTFMDHTFDIPLKKGRNLLAGKILSGSLGFTLAIGSPEELQKATGKSPNSLELTYTYNNSTVTQPLDIDFQRPIEALGSLTFDSPQDEWDQNVPNIVLGDQNLVNLHFKAPDATLWWKGYNDLSASAWLRADDKNLYLIIKVTDDIYRTASGPSKLADFDSVKIALSPASGSDITTYQIGQVDGQTVIMKSTNTSATSPAGNEIRAQISRTDTTTLYRIAISRALTTDSCYLNFQVNDNDTGIRKQYLQWKPGIETLENPTNWSLIRYGNSR